MSENDEALLFESLRLELRRGSLILAVLASLRREQYGYSLRVALGEVGVEMEESTLYPPVSYTHLTLPTNREV